MAGLNDTRHWTFEDVQRLRALVRDGATAGAISMALGRPIEDVTRKIAELGEVVKID